MEMNSPSLKMERDFLFNREIVDGSRATKDLGHKDKILIIGL